MKYLKYIVLGLIVAFATAGATAQVVKKNDGDRRDKKDESAVKVSDRQQAFYEQREPSEADLQWSKVVYRILDLTKGKNPALYYPEEPNEDGQSMFFIIMRLLANNQISAYEYLDGREMFTDEYKIKVAELFDRFHVLYSEAKGSTEKNPKYAIEDADIPGNEILSYYIIEKWEFDTRTNAMRCRVDAICPVLHREDGYGGEPIKFPMFWVKLNDIRPYIAQQYIFTDDDNNLTRYNLDDFFKLNMYTGDIYKVKNLRNQSLMQLYPEPEALKHAQDSIEERLHRFDKNLWAPTREELQAMAEAKCKLEAEQRGETLEEGESEGATVKEEKKDSGKSVKTKRGSSNDSKDNKKKTTKKKVQKAKQSSNQGAGRSVRNRKR
ncbi:MAG: gliding motility protein GldN [Muribaculaceae bacterium]|nr:gliding motility protein GldN [Muribaculaceae bacterium]MBR5118623.1 gliding motility protein GldN [Muribaculaceae bacterium]